MNSRAGKSRLGDGKHRINIQTFHSFARDALKGEFLLRHSYTTREKLHYKHDTHTAVHAQSDHIYSSIRIDLSVENQKGRTQIYPAETRRHDLSSAETIVFVHFDTRTKRTILRLF